jgi:hypothetical protein
VLVLTCARPAVAEDVAPPPANAPSAPASEAPAPPSAPEASGAPEAPQLVPAAPLREDPTLRKNVAERRAGLVLGIAPGLAFAGASGYPNNVRLIDNPAFYSSSGLLVGSSTTIFLLGALTDYVSFGPMVNIASFETDTWTSKGFGVGFRAEAFPLVHLVPRLADTALYGQAGIGSTELKAKGPFPSADGTQSFAGVGAHHEFRLFTMLGGHVSGGPYAEYDAIFSSSAERHWATLGLRVAWYGGSVGLDPR